MPYFLFPARAFSYFYYMATFRCLAASQLQKPTLNKVWGQIVSNDVTAFPCDNFWAWWLVAQAQGLLHGGDHMLSILESPDPLERLSECSYGAKWQRRNKVEYVLYTLVEMSICPEYGQFQEALCSPWGIFNLVSIKVRYLKHIKNMSFLRHMF